MRRPDLITGALAAAALGFVLSDWRESEGGAGILFGSERTAAAEIAWPPGASRVPFDEGLAAAGDAPLLVYGRIEAPHVLAFEREAAASSLLKEALGNARVAVVDVGSDLPDALRGTKLLRAVPALLAVRRGDRVVVKTTGGEVMVKELKRRTTKIVELQSLNPSHPDRTLAPSEVEWIARIVWASQ